ncbi:uncharacterized protein LACBIDRAFT_335766 [Laccaria bicolor S238N-H82]|uniref:Predicted protein n=1 Tax=Laccaria bicolor (strain S238N-H82 / ATCC MYA-4686) TaxID=486041 RepID=B0E3C2_LACBS|nr:uncharacterized protein LACBIDRAFT_335766 [Laccaria bicolor S238N-H82]EDQ98659.1 predicted protein [Laccaria bicolor S238N-H82]|eukprot:XP_001890691.1 predicted protein [Laccaria bicolor S238N-H82]
MERKTTRIIDCFPCGLNVEALNCCNERQEIILLKDYDENEKRVDGAPLTAFSRTIERLIDTKQKNESTERTRVVMNKGDSHFIGLPLVVRATVRILWGGHPRWWDGVIVPMTDVFVVPNTKRKRVYVNVGHVNVDINSGASKLESRLRSMSHYLWSRHIRPMAMSLVSAGGSPGGDLVKSKITTAWSTIRQEELKYNQVVSTLHALRVDIFAQRETRDSESINDTPALCCALYIGSARKKAPP